MSEDHHAEFEKALEQETDTHWSDFMTIIKEGAEHNAQNIKWDHDILPMMFVQGTLVKGMPGIGAEAVGQQGLMIVGIGRFADAMHEGLKLAQMMRESEAKKQQEGEEWKNQ